MFADFRNAKLYCIVLLVINSNVWSWYHFGITENIFFL